MSTSDFTKNIKVFKLDKNFFTGSADTFRRLVGGTYRSSFDPGITIGDEPPSIGTYLRVKKVDTAHAGKLNDVDAYELTTPYKVKYIQLNADMITTSSTGPIKRYRYPVRIIGKDSEIKNSDEWKSIILGGQYGPEQYEKIFTDGVYDTYGHKYDTYYYQLEKNKIELAAENAGISKPDLNSYDIGYKYNSYLRTYQEHIANLEEKQLPNIYFNEVYALSTDGDETEFAENVRPELEAFVSRENVDTFIKNPHAPKDEQLTKSPPPYILSIKIGATDRTGTSGVDITGAVVQTTFKF